MRFGDAKRPKGFAPAREDGPWNPFCEYRNTIRDVLPDVGGRVCEVDEGSVSQVRSKIIAALSTGEASRHAFVITTKHRSRI